MSKSRGKKFEEHFKDNLIKINNISVERLKDTMDGFKGNANICDFIVYHYPNQFCLELKSIQGKYFSFNNITEKQYQGLLSKVGVKGVIPGVVVWFVDYDKTLFVPIDEIRKAKEKGVNSINMNNVEDYDVLEIDGRKKRVFFEYDIIKFLKEAKDRYGR